MPGESDNRLAKMFAPPFEIMFRGDFEAVITTYSGPKASPGGCKVDHGSLA
jgi:hypothetical protein